MNGLRMPWIDLQYLPVNLLRLLQSPNLVMLEGGPKGFVNIHRASEWRSGSHLLCILAAVGGRGSESQQHLDDGCCTDGRYDGVMSLQSAYGMRDITDGTSNTLAFGEIVGQGPGTYHCCAWHAYSDGFGMVNGLNAPFRSTPNRAPPFPLLNMWGGSPYTGFASYHPGGVHFVRADGSVTFLSQNIAQLTLQAMGSRAKGEVFDSVE